MEFECFVLNFTSLSSLDCLNPFGRLKGQNPDIIMILCFKFFGNEYVKSRWWRLCLAFSLYWSY